METRQAEGHPLKSSEIHSSHFRRHLQKELVRRCQQNPGYSLRAFARALNVGPAALSQIINGKRPISNKMRLRLGSALGLSVHEILLLDENSAVQNANALKFQQMTLDTFALLSEWYNYAILELTNVDGFKTDAGWIAGRLGITKSEANIAIERLFRMGLLKTNADQSWCDASENGVLTHITPGQTSDAARNYQAQLLELSKRALQELPLERRSHTSAAFCFDTSDTLAAVTCINEFRRSFALKFQPKQNADEVYQIQISFYPLTKTKKGESHL